MKIIIPKGENINIAINKIQEFINKNYEEYPILEKELNLYINLTNAENQICPDNKIAFKILETKEGIEVENLLETAKNKAISKAIESFNSEKCLIEENINRMKYKIKLDENYLSTAIEKKRKQDKIDERRLLFENAKKDLINLENQLIIYNEIYKKYIKDRLSVIFIKYERYRNYNKCNYIYPIDAILIFEDIYGEDYYYDINIRDKKLVKGKFNKYK